MEEIEAHRICEKCNKEFMLKLTQGIVKVSTIQSCPHCKSRNDVWIQIRIKTD